MSKLTEKLTEKPTEEPTYQKCIDCDDDIEIPKNPLPNEVVSCESCGLNYEVKKKNDHYELEELILAAGEDHGE